MYVGINIAESLQLLNVSYVPGIEKKRIKPLEGYVLNWLSEHAHFKNFTMLNGAMLEIA